MATAELFGRVIAAIEAVVGSKAQLDEIVIDARSLPDGMLRVSLTTPEPGRFIGRRGATADALRARLANDLAREVQLNLLESRLQAPPLEPPSGVREPRRPRPGGPPIGASARPPRAPRSPEQMSPPSTGRPMPPPPPSDQPEERPQRRGAA
jgi:predicted RNA-binding protein YlqC (UPF0109 family)